ncbi:conserved hypothetical protein [Trichinella spiralis]|uniref:hypothetical protein n=1 Tax=Trichinella spiralis TaxID=6334 RepID=UPI0001EFC8E1|nr:conserved hypothetical protein [Trichinella spiralis]
MLAKYVQVILISRAGTALASLRQRASITQPQWTTAIASIIRIKSRNVGGHSRMSVMFILLSRFDRFSSLLGPANLNLATPIAGCRPSTGRREQLLKTPEQAGKQADGLKSLLECKGGRQISALKHLSMLAGYERRSKTR